MNDKIIYNLDGVTFINNTIIRPGFTTELGYTTYLGQTTLTISAPVEITATRLNFNQFIVPLVEDLNYSSVGTQPNFYKGTPYFTFGWGQQNVSHYINAFGQGNTWESLRISTRQGTSRLEMGISIIRFVFGSANNGLVQVLGQLNANYLVLGNNIPTSNFNSNSFGGISITTGPTANGTMYYDSTQNKIRVYSGTTWRYLQYEP